MIHHLISHTVAAAALLGAVCFPSGLSAAEAAADEPIIMFTTSIYETYGPDNVFSLAFGATADGTEIAVDCGFGKKTYSVDVATLDSSTGSLSGTMLADLSVSAAGIVKVYGDASKFDYFNASGCYIRHLDMSKMTDLLFLDLSHNELEALDLTPHTKLQYVCLSDNPYGMSPLVVGAPKDYLTILELDQVGNLDPNFDMTQYPALASFQAWDTMALTQLDPSNCPDLFRLSIDATSVSSLDVTNNPKLQVLNIADSRVKSVDLSQNPDLVELYCAHESGTINTDIKMDAIDVTHNPELLYLYASGNNFKSVDLSHNTKLMKLGLDYNYLTQLDLSKNTALNAVSVKMNDMNFATLPAPSASWNEYYYMQRDLALDRSYPEGHELDFSAQVLRDGTTTMATVYVYDAVNPNNVKELGVVTDESGQIVEDHRSEYFSYADGKLTLLKATADSIYVSFSNSMFAEYPLETSKFMVKTADDFGKPNEVVSLATPVAAGGSVAFGLGVAGASADSPKEVYVDFGDGTPVAFNVVTDALLDAPNVTGTRAGSGQITVSVPEGESLTALDASFEMYEIDVTAARDLLYLSVRNAGLTSIDLSWNRYLRSLDLSGNKLSSLSLSGVNALYNKNFLSDVNISNNRISELEIPYNAVLYRFDVSHNQFESLSLTEATNLRELNASYNRLSTINLSYCEMLTDADLSHNRMTSVAFPETNNIKRLALNDNGFTFATLPRAVSLPGVTDYVYAPQSVIAIPSKGNGLDLSAQNITVDGHTTVFVWKNEAGQAITEGVDYEIENGKTTFINTEMGKVYCEMTNAAYPDMTGDNALRTGLIEAAGMPTVLLASFVTPVGGENVELSLRAAEGNPALYVGWTGDNNLAQYMLNSDTYTLFTAQTTAGATVNVYTYDETDRIDIFSVSGATMSSMDASGFKDLINFTVTEAGLSEITLPQSPGLQELNLTGNAFTEFDLSQCPEVWLLYMSGNRLTSIDLSKNRKLVAVYLSANDLSTITLDNPQLNTLELSDNQFTELSLDGVPNLAQLMLSGNALTELDVTPCKSTLSALLLDRNRFTFATLPVLTNMSKYVYANQAMLDVTPADGVVDLSSQVAVGDVATDYAWYIGVPTVDENGDLQGERLFVDDEYLLENGVTSFLKPFDGVMCVMTNAVFPDLWLYTPLINVTAAGIGDISAAGSNDGVTVIVDGRSVIVRTVADTDVTIYTAGGTAVRAARTVDGEARLSDLMPGVYVVTAGSHASKLLVR